MPGPTLPRHVPEYPPEEALQGPTGLHFIGTRDLDFDHPAWDTYPYPDTLPPDPMPDVWQSFLESINATGLLPT